LVEAEKLLGGKATLIHGLFEDVALPCRYENIVLTHVLEHLDDPVRVLKRINDEWLSDSGRFFLVCPNANAPSRQIAVKMGLISHNAAVTPAEAAHGHRITYSLDTLERDAVAAGLKVIHRSGIFFKALANFQWDRLLQTDIISPAYLEGCYAFGQQYPDLCSSIFLLCEKGPKIA
jgi:2-polyprenyl-3-methyl-5-hydroxy-6-metoxy-1,4-benzoquinol methylase